MVAAKRRASSSSSPRASVLWRSWMAVTPVASQTRTRSSIVAGDRSVVIAYSRAPSSIERPLATGTAPNLYSGRLNFLDGVLVAAFVLAVIDGARRGLSPYLAEFAAFVLSLAVAFTVFGPIAVVASRFLHVPASAAAVGVFVLVVAAAHGLAWPSLHRWTGALERRLPRAGRRLGSVPALATALGASTVVLAALA